jgi:Spy/CpxP family protein refolding chaperone
MPRKLFLYFLSLILAGMASATWALAQPGVRPGGFEDQFQAVKRSQMGPALGVDQGTVDKLLQIDQQYQPQRQQLVQESKSEFMRLRQIMSQPNPPESEVQSVLANMKAKQREIERLKQRQDEEEMAVLTPVQYARYVLYLQNVMREARSVKAAPGGRGSASAPRRGAPMVPSAPREIPVGRQSPPQ